MDNFIKSLNETEKVQKEIYADDPRNAKNKVEEKIKLIPKSTIR